MHTFISWTSKGLKVIGIGLVVVVAVAVGMWLLLLKPVAEKQANPTKDPDRQLIKGARGEDAAQFQHADDGYLVPKERVPADQKARYEAAPITLLSDRWATAEKEQPGPEDDISEIPSKERRAMLTDVAAFLKLWETFSPLPADGAQNSRDTYAAKLAPWVEPGSLGDIVKRVDNIQPQRICPNGCAVGSQWHAGDIWNAANVRYYTGDEAYVTAYGAVRYIAALPNESLDGVAFNRSYGLLLRRSGKRWLVTRAAAGSLGVMR